MGATVCRSDPSVFVWHSDSELIGILCTHVDDFLFVGTQFFIENIIAPLKQTFTIGTECCTAFKYLGLNITQSSKEIVLDQVDYINSLEYIKISNTRKIENLDPVSDEEFDSLRTLIGQ